MLRHRSSQLVLFVPLQAPKLAQNWVRTMQLKSQKMVITKVSSLQQPDEACYSIVDFQEFCAASGCGAVGDSRHRKACSASVLHVIACSVGIKVECACKESIILR
jgi:hypothetical protein